MALSRVTIKDVAQEAGVSIATVYRAVNNKGRISDETRVRILDTVDRLGYKANAAARGLALRKKFNILVVLPERPRQFWDDVKKGVRRAAAQLSDYGVEIIECYHENSLASVQPILVGGMPILEFIHGKEIDAIILSIVNMPDSTSILQFAAERKIPVATVNEDTASQERLFFYGPDNYLAGRMAAELIDKFCSRQSHIAVVSTQAAYAYSTHEYRRKGFLDYFQEKPDDRHACDVYYCTALEAPGFLPELMRKKPEIEALYFDQFTTLLASCSELAKLAEKPKVVGHEYDQAFDAYFYSGVITAMLVQEKVCQGYFPVMMMYRYLASGEKVGRSHFYSNINVIIEGNLGFLQHDDNGCGYE